MNAMIYPSDIQSLISRWEERLKNNTMGDMSYWLALNECLTDLKGLVNATIDEQLQQIEKDRYLNTLTPDELREYFATDEYNPAMDDDREPLFQVC